MSGDVRPWGIFATFVLGAIALLAGQLSGMAALSRAGMDSIWGRSRPSSQDGGAIILFIFVSAPVQVAVLVLAAAYKGNVADYLGYKLPRRGEVVLRHGSAGRADRRRRCGELACRPECRRSLSDRHLPGREKRRHAAIAAGCGHSVHSDQRGESVSRFPVSRLAEIAALGLARHRVHRGTVCGHPRSIRLVSHRAGVCFRRVVRMDAMGDRIDPPDHAAARPGQSGRHDRNGFDLNS